MDRGGRANVKIGDGTYLMESDDDYLAHVGTTFEPAMEKLFRRLVRSEDRCLDIGANVGFTAILFAQLAARVDAFEPSPTTFDYLQRNVRCSQLRNITLHNVGLGTIDEDLTLTFAPTNRAGAFVSNQTQASGGHTVEPIRVRNGDALVGEQPIDFVKIDVEGFELHVLRGLTASLHRHRPVVVLELNHWCLNAFQRTSVPDFFDELLAVFPFLYAVHGDSTLDLRNNDQRYIAMYRHILHLEYCNLVGAFEADRIRQLVPA